MKSDSGALATKAETLRALHHGDSPLVLPNAWDVSSARSVEAAGFPAVATTSGGIAAALGYPDHAARIADVKAAAKAVGVDLVINARVDVYARQVEPALQMALERGRAYVDAGADCVFPILVRDEEHIAALVAALGIVNVYWRSGWPSIDRLAELGVRRISFGSGIQRAAATFVDDVVRRIKDGDYTG